MGTPTVAATASTHEVLALGKSREGVLGDERKAASYRPPGAVPAYLGFGTACAGSTCPWAPAPQAAVLRPHWQLPHQWQKALLILRGCHFPPPPLPTLLDRPCSAAAQPPGARATTASSPSSPPLPSAAPLLLTATPAPTPAPALRLGLAPWVLGFHIRRMGPKPPSLPPSAAAAPPESLQGEGPRPTEPP